MADFDVFFKKILMKYGLEHFGVFYGSYRGIVTANNDPQARGRIQAKVPGVGQLRGPLEQWIIPAESGAGLGVGNFFPPEVGANVFVEFENGDPSNPSRYHGGWYRVNGTGSPFSYSESGFPERRGIITRAGHHLLFSDEAGAERVRLTFHVPAEDDPMRSDRKIPADLSTGLTAILGWEPDGTFVVTNTLGARIELNASEDDESRIQVIDERGNTIVLDQDGIKVVNKEGNFVTLEGGKITVSGSDTVAVTAPTVNIKSGKLFLGDGASQSVVLGESFQQLFNGHQHPTGTGLSGPPNTPMSGAHKSANVKTRS